MSDVNIHQLKKDTKGKSLLKHHLKMGKINTKKNTSFKKSS